MSSTITKIVQGSFQQPRTTLMTQRVSPLISRLRMPVVNAARTPSWNVRASATMKDAFQHALAPINRALALWSPMTYPRAALTF